jgi:hypothetical protein
LVFLAVGGSSTILLATVESGEKIHEIPQKVSRFIVADRTIEVLFEIRSGVSD